MYIYIYIYICVYIYTKSHIVVSFKSVCLLFVAEYNS